MAKQVDLGELMELISGSWPFDDKNYPGFDNLTNDQKLTFIVKHSILHINKSLGKLAREVESADHGNEFSTQMSRIATGKLLVNVLNLAHKLKMSPEALSDLAETILRGE